MVNALTMDLFNDPFFIGFDRQFKELQNINRNTSNYPPHNIARVIGSEDQYVIELATAGFGKNDIEVEQDKNVLTIKGNAKEEITKEYIYKGIGGRSFVKTFSLAEYVKVDSVAIINGILCVFLIKVVPDSEKPKKFTIHDFDLTEGFDDVKDTEGSTKKTKK
jgi:molecular chaperone IbpA